MNPKGTVCLIIPPSPFLMDERVFMSLGILRVAAVMEKAGYTVEMLDLSGIANYLEAVRDHAAATEAQHFGITATTPQMPATMEIAEAIWESAPRARVILGGPHVTLTNAARKREEHLCIPNGRAQRAFRHLSNRFDVLVAGDGETAGLLALQPAAPKLIDADDPKSSLFLTNDLYNGMPFPSRHLVDVASYHYTIDGERALSLIAQLGCPFGCGFCGGRESAMLRRIRTRTTANILGEIEHLYRDHGVKGIMMYDDELNVNKQMVELMRGIRDLQRNLGVEFRLRGFIKSELFTDEQAQAMHEAGFRWILVGFESGAERILENINKKATRQDNSRCMEIARRHGLKVKALMSIGHPGESEETVRQTTDWLLQERPDDFDVTIITTYPGSPYYDHATETAPGIWTYTAKSGDRLHAYEVDYTKTADYYKGRVGDYHAYVYTDHLCAEQLVKARDAIEAQVRASLGIPYNTEHAAMRYEHSMGMGLPANILRRSVL